MLILLIGLMTFIIVLSATKWNCAALIERRLSVTNLTSIRIISLSKKWSLTLLYNIVIDIFAAGAEKIFH